MLKSLEVFGFKSFADRTLFEFAEGITCVVGPNGSGKSNVVDAMKWLLGDQSPKSLRGKSMSDVIFSGSRSRKPSGFAEASLTFGNSTRFLDFDADEVRITRRLYQGGDSEYLINGEIVRLKDIRELFMGTGAATSAYSIIEQGRVAQILQGNPSTRRVLFDEAAGISRYKSRRVDAERKLERVSQNLLRLTDIVDEVETQLHARRSQAGKAAKFRDLARSYDSLWLGLAADDSRRLFFTLTNRQAEIATLTEQVNQTKVEQQSFESQRKQLRDEFTRIDEQLQQTEGSLSTLMQQRSSLQTSLHHQSERSSEIDHECEILHKQRQELKRRVHEIQQEIVNEEELFLQAKLAVEQKLQEQHLDESQLAEFTQRIDLQRESQTNLSREQQEQLRLQATSENHLVHLKQRQETILAAVERVQGEIEQAAEAIHQRTGEVENAQEVYEQAASINQEHKQRIDQIKDRKQELRHELEAIHARLREDREQRSAWEARLGLLEDMERRQLGLSVGVQEILQRSRQSPLPPWKHVLGILADYIECELEYAPLIEIAFAGGGGSEMIIVDQLQPILEYLDRGETQFEGRIGFLEIPSGKAAMSVESTDPVVQNYLETLRQSENVIARADHLVQCEPAYRGLIERYLSHTWVVDTLATARRFSLAAPIPLQFLTLQGDMLDRDGMIQTGTLQMESSIVSRRSEIKRLKKEVEQLDRHIYRLTDKTTEFDDLLTRLDAEIKNAQSWMEEQSTELTELSQKLMLARTNQKQAIQEKGRLEQDLAALSQQQQDVVREIEQEQFKLEEYHTTLNAIAAQIATGEEELQLLQDQKQELITNQSQYQLGLAKVEEQLTAIENVLKRLRNDSRLRDNQYNEAESRLNLAIQKKNQTELQILNAQSQLAELYLIGEQLQSETRRIRRMRGETQIQRDHLTEQLRSITESRRTHEQQLQDLRIEQKDLENELESIVEKLSDDYQLTLRDLHEHKISAFTPYHAMRSGEEILELELPQPATTQQAEEQEEESENAELILEQSDFEQADEIESPRQNEQITDLLSLIDAELLEQNPWAWEDSEIPYEQAREEIEREVQRLRKKIKKLGAVDPESLQGLDEIEFRYKHLSTQLQDLRHAQATLEDIIRKLNSESRRIFLESFITIREQFQNLYRQLFGGGEGDLIMEDEADPLECGIEIVARPPGKELRSISLLSGGEKTMTAVALLLAIFKSRPSPFCILDEVDAALDEANIDRFASVLTQFHDQTQFIVITHRKRTMTAADRIFGVTMEEAGISKRLTVQVDDVGENGEFKSKGNSAAA